MLLARDAPSLLERFAREDPPDDVRWIAEGAHFARVVRELRLGQITLNAPRLPLRLDPDTRIFFLDGGTYDAAGEVGWVMGETAAELLLEGTRPIAAVSVRATNGDRPNVVTLESAAGARSIALARGQSVVARLRLGPGMLLDGRRHWKLTVRSGAGYFPILTGHEPDPRYLGVHVDVRPVY